jgi:hypothetical protein
MDEAAALLHALESTPPRAPTACAGWTAHELVAHLAAGAAEMADLVELAAAQRSERATRAFAEREAPFAALDDDVLRERLIVEALRLHAAIDALDALDRTEDDATVLFAGRRLTSGELTLHGRSEAALHRFDLAGFDDVSRELLTQRELTAHGLTVLNAMLDGSAESIACRVAAACVRDQRLSFGSPGEPDVVLVVDDTGARFELDDACAPPLVRADAATRLLALWGRRADPELLHWSDAPDAGVLAAVLFPATA